MFLTRSARVRRVAPLLYNALVAQARAPVFYSDLGVPDTIEGRYEMIVLHMALLLRRLRDGGAAQAPLAQAVVDFMASDLDRSMRELGVGDLSVARYMKRLGEGFFGRATAYDSALDGSAGAESLDVVVRRNLYDGASPGEPALATICAYVRQQRAGLAEQKLDAIAGGTLAFTQPGWSDAAIPEKTDGP
jgi:cytochrome b pre-mRNA-processing protein 3